MQMNKLAVAVMAAGFSLALTGCGGSSSSSNEPAAPQEVTYAGKVLTEGSVVGATVCLDENENLTCDADEPSATTDGDGNFSITTDETDANLVAESAAVEGLTVFVSPANTGSIAPGTRLTAPNSAQIISLFTTAAQVRALTTGVSYAEAEQQLAESLGLGSDTDLGNLDYTAEGGDPKVLAAAQTIASLVGGNLTTILSNGGGSTPTATTILAFNDLFKQDASGKSRLQVITETLANTDEANLGQAVNTLVQQNIIDPADIQSELDRIQGILNGSITPTPDPTGGTGGDSGDGTQGVS